MVIQPQSVSTKNCQFIHSANQSLIFYDSHRDYGFGF